MPQSQGIVFSRTATVMPDPSLVAAAVRLPLPERRGGSAARQHVVLETALTAALGVLVRFAGTPRVLMVAILPSRIPAAELIGVPLTIVM
jgi:hypothetical protein